MIAFLADGLRHLVGHVGGGRVAARRVFENVGVVELHFAAERQRQFKILLGLARKADDDVRGDADARLGAAQFLDDAEKFFARVAAVHQFQNAVAAALQRNDARSRTVSAAAHRPPPDRRRNLSDAAR